MGKDSLLHDLILSQYKEVTKPLKESKRVPFMLPLKGQLLEMFFTTSLYPRNRIRI